MRAVIERRGGDGTERGSKGMTGEEERSMEKKD